MIRYISSETMLMEIIAVCYIVMIFVMSWLDRQRGTPKNEEKIPKLLALLGMGYLSAVYTGHVLDWQAVMIMLSVAITNNIGFGHPVGLALTGRSDLDPDGGKYEAWQITRLLRENPWVALSLRGVFVGVGALVAMDWIASLKIAIAFGIGYPLAAYIVRYKLKMGEEGWAKMEELRGGLIGAVFCIMAVGVLLLER